MTLRTTNFATPRAARTRTWSLGLWLAALACLVLAVWLGTRAVDLNNQTAQLAAHMDGTSEVASANAAEQVNVPTQAEFHALDARIAFFNDLSGPRHLPLAGVLSRLEAVLPAQVWLRTLVYDLKSGRLNFAVLSADETLLPGVLKKIEGAQGFSDVILERQIRVRQTGQVLTQYDVGASTE